MLLLRFHLITILPNTYNEVDFVHTENLSNSEQKSYDESPHIKLVCVLCATFLKGSKQILLRYRSNAKLTITRNLTVAILG